MNSTTRLYSLDAFRGFTVAAMVLVNNPGDWSHVYPPLLHAPWHGWTFTDTIFPFFLFIVGVSMVVSTRAKGEAGVSHATLLQKLWLRCALIAAIGLALNLFPQFDFSTVRIPGVLQRIGLASALAAPLVVLLGWRAWIAAAIVLFALYAGLMFGVPAPDYAGVMVTGVLEPGRDFAAYIDRTVFGAHLWKSAKTWDPEGLISTLPAVVNVLVGALVGHSLLIRMQRRSRVGGWVLLGAILILTGGVLDIHFMPINKNLWTISYSMFMSGWAMVTFAAFYGLLDADPKQPFHRWLRYSFLPFVMLGMNALFIFVLSGVLARILLLVKVDGVSLKTQLFTHVQLFVEAPRLASLSFALAFSFLLFGCAWGMWRKRWFVKI